MTTAELKSIFESPYNRAEWIKVLRDVFQVRDIHSSPQGLTLPENEFNANGLELGSFETSEGLMVGLYEVAINPEKKIERNKVGLRNLLRKVYKNDVDAALVVFTQGSKWRFTYVSEITVFNKETGKRENRQTDPKRYTYVLGQHQLCRTPAERFAALKTSPDLFDNRVSIKDIEKAFSVDLLTKDFYRELSHWYFLALQYVRFPDDVEKDPEIRNSTNTIRLITRLIFVWFLKQKNLVPEILFDKDKIWPILKPGYESKSTYYKAILQNLFFATLNQEMGKRGFRKGKQHYNITNLFRYENLFHNPEAALELFKGIPFLNGGLFECLDKSHPTEKTSHGAERIIRIDGFSDRDDNPVHVPDFLFFGGAEAVDLSMVYDDSRQKNLKIRGLIDILNSYNFTVEENTPLDIQVALDPELLGKVFENLLASYNPETKTTARKQTGSFYTPREIVQYMLDESLIAYLKHYLNKDDGAAIERNESRLRELLSYSGNGNPFNLEETRSLIEAIDQVKVLDPACGSGAFPMGVLQQLVHILQKLDPDNTEWKKIQMGKAQADLQEAIARGDTENFSESLKDIAESFETNTEDYGRKLFLIENCIYGVDIQPIAVQIAKLRFFVSLLCEQTIQEEKENLGIKALPNLETKFVAANTLIALDKPVLATGNIFLSDTQTEFEKLKKELNENRHKYFVAKRREQKLKCHLKDKEIREKIAKLLVNEGWKTEIAKQVASYDPYDQNQHSDWFDPEWMLGVNKGFDIIIGNPPYLSAVSMARSSEQKKYFKNKYPEASGAYDIYILFLLEAINLLNPNGVYSWIIPNKFLIADYAKKTKEKLLKNGLLFSIDVSTFDVFESTSVYPIIIIGRKSSKFNFKELLIEKVGDLERKEFIEPVKLKKHATFKDFGIKFASGATGFEAQKIKLLISEERKFNSIPFIVSGCIDRYCFLNRNVRYMGSKYKEAFILNSSVIAQSKWEFWNNPKIAIAGMTQVVESVFVEEPLALGVGVYAIFDFSGFDPFSLTAILNSKYITYFINNKFKDKHLAGGYLAINKTTLESLPLVKPSQQIQKRLSELSVKIHLKKKSDLFFNTEIWEKEIDKIVFRLYSLDYNEVIGWFPDFSISEKEYENINLGG